MTKRTATVLLSRISETTLRNTYGILVSIIVATNAQFISEHYGAPAMLMALLLGMAFQFLSEDGRCADGIAFTSRTVLRLGVALLGVRISFNLLADLGPGLVGLVILGVCLTIVAGVLSD